MKKLKLLLLLTAMLLAITETQAQRKKAPVVEPVGMGDGYPPASDETPPVAETPATEEPKKEITDADYKKQFDLLTLYTFLGNYIDSNRAEIKREGESVFYKTEARFPGTVDNYIEVKQGKGELKYVFYSGNDYTAAMNKYRELEEICKRIKENDLTVTESKYCEGCYGLRFGAEQSVHYWLQVINKPAGGWDVMIIHAMGLDKYYLKEVARPAATTPAKTSSSGKSATDMVADMEAVNATDKLVRAQAVQTAVQEDFCTTVNRVISELNNGFGTWKGPEHKQYFSIGKSWYAKYMVKGSAYATIYENMESRLYTGADGKPKNSNVWHGVLFEGKSDFSKVLSMYQGYVSKMNACTQSCCTFTSTTESKRDLGSTGQVTTWKVSNVQPGSNIKYKDMKISIRFSMNTVGGDWIVDIWVE